MPVEQLIGPAAYARPIEQPATGTAPNANRVTRRCVYVRIDTYAPNDVRFVSVIENVSADRDATPKEWTIAARLAAYNSAPLPSDVISYHDYCVDISDEALKRASSIKAPLTPAEEKALLTRAGI